MSKEAPKSEKPLNGQAWTRVIEALSHSQRAARYVLRFLELIVTKEVRITRLASPFSADIKPYGAFSGELAHIIRAAIELKSADYWEAVQCEGKIVVDIGAFVGDSARYFLARGAAKVYCFEPSTRVLREALENTKNARQVKVYHEAVGLVDGVVSLRSTRMGLSYSRGSGEIVNVVSFRHAVERILNREGRADVLKLDCEGCEWDVLTIENIDVLQEFESIAVEIHGQDSIRLVHFLKMIGFMLTGYRRTSTSPLVFRKRYRCDRLTSMGIRSRLNAS